MIYAQRSIRFRCKATFRLKHGNLKDVPKNKAILKQFLYKALFLLGGKMFLTITCKDDILGKYVNKKPCVKN